MDEALASLDRAIELEPRNAQAYQARANVRRAKGDTRGAMADYDLFYEMTALAAKPKSSP